MKKNLCETPPPVVREARIRLGNRQGDRPELVFTDPQTGDYVNLTSGVVRMSRFVDGRRRDTSRDMLIVGAGDFDGYLYDLRRIYRTAEGRFHLVRLQWSEDLGLMLRAACTELDPTTALSVALRLLRPCDIHTFVRDWYAMGWFPREDSVIRPWVERNLSADHCESLLAVLSPTPS